MKRVVLLLICVSALEAHQPWVMGHRGARAARPENTMAAFHYAVDLGVDVVELDMVVTADDRIIVSHDVTVDLNICKLPGAEQPNRPVYIRSLTFDELRRFDCGSTANPAYPNQRTVAGERMPALEEVFGYLKNKKAKVMIETKMTPPDSPYAVSPKHFTELAYKVIRQFGLQDRIILQSFDHRTLREMKKVDGSIRLCMLNPRKHLDNYVHPAKELGATYQFINWSVIREDDVKALHAAGLKVFSGTTDDPKVWRRLVELDVDGILTDDPGGLIDFLKGHPQRRPFAAHIQRFRDSNGKVSKMMSLPTTSLPFLR